MSRGRWESRARGSKGAGTCGGGWRSRGRGRVHGGGSWAGGWGQADRWGQRDRERSGRTSERNGEDRPGPRGREREGERARGLAPTGGALLSVTLGVRARAHARLTGLTGLKWVFYFPGNF
jgi:hypothetical protein